MIEKKKTKSDINFEESLKRLEEILETMNSGNTSLDESLELFEEADGHLKKCSKRLTDAEKKIEILIKKRGGDLKLDHEGTPITEAFETP